MRAPELLLPNDWFFWGTRGCCRTARVKRSRGCLCRIAFPPPRREREESMANWADHATDGLMWIAEILLYLLPAIVALSRQHPLKILILALNVFLGWTAVGWAAALVWALVKPAPLAVIHPM